MRYARGTRRTDDDSTCDVHGRVHAAVSATTGRKGPLMHLCQPSLQGDCQCGCNKNDLRNHCAIIQPRLYDGAMMVTQTRLYDGAMVTQIILKTEGPTESPRVRGCMMAQWLRRSFLTRTPRVRSLPGTLLRKSFQDAGGLIRSPWHRPRLRSSVGLSSTRRRCVRARLTSLE